MSSKKSSSKTVTVKTTAKSKTSSKKTGDVKKSQQQVKLESWKKKVKKATNAGNYQIWLTYNSNKKRLQIPVLPEKVEISYPDKDDSTYVYGVGEVIIAKHPGAVQIKFSSIFPDGPCQGSISNPKDPKEAREFMENMMNRTAPGKFIITAGPCSVNIACRISFECYEIGGDVGTLYYTLTVTEYKKTSVRKLKVAKSGTTKTKKAKVTSSSKRASTKTNSETYVVKSGDCLWNLAVKYYGKGSEYTKIYNANKEAIESDAKKHGYKSSNNGSRIWVGLKLTIPNAS
jgi:hypothetical protein